MRRREFKRRLRRRKRTPAYFRSERHDWATPPDLFARLHEEFRFTLDACAHEGNHKLPRWYGRGGIECDGLAQSWTGERVWMNPPYGKAISIWTAKAKREAQAGVLVVGLVPVRTDTRWWRENVVGADVRFLPGRLRFVGSKHAAPFASAIVVWREVQR